MSRTFFNFFKILFSQVVRFWPSATFISYHRFKCLSRTFLSFFRKNFLNFIFQKLSSFLSATFTSYHRWSCLSRTFFISLKNFFKFLSSSSATSDIIPYTYHLVNNFLQKKFNFFIFSFYNANLKLTKPFYLLIYKAFLLFSFYSHFYYIITFIPSFLLIYYPLLY